jgi:hypothetical protein
MNKSVCSLKGLILIFILGTLILGISGCSSIRRLLSRTPVGPASVVFKVTGRGGQAYITYTRADGSVTESTKVNLPWQSPAMIFPSSSLLVLTAAGIPETGGVVCSILVNGIEVERRTGEPSEDKATCGYITGR